MSSKKLNANASAFVPPGVAGAGGGAVSWASAVRGSDESGLQQQRQQLVGLQGAQVEYQTAAWEQQVAWQQYQQQQQQQQQQYQQQQQQQQQYQQQQQQQQYQQGNAWFPPQSQQTPTAYSGFGGQLDSAESLGRVAAMLKLEEGTWLCSIDVECVATGKLNSDRAVARIAMVDENERVVFDRLVKPDQPIVSHLTELTGIVPGSLDNAEPLDKVRADLVKVLPPNALLVGQAIHKDIEWLGLERGVHFAQFFDIAKFFAIKHKNGYERFFSLRHEVLHLRGFEGAGSDIQAGVHDPAVDAIFSIRVFKAFRRADAAALRKASTALSRAPETPAFWKTTPLIDGVQMGPIIRNK